MTTRPYNSSPDDLGPLDAALPLIEAVLDGTAHPDEERRLDELCARYPECARERDLAQSLRTAFSSLKTAPTPPSVTRSVFREIRRRRWLLIGNLLRGALIPTPTSRFRPALALASLAVAVVAVFAVLRPPAVEEEVEVYSEADVRAAVEELKWTLAYVGGVGKKTGKLVREEVVEPHVMSPISRSLEAAIGPSPLGSHQ